MLKKQQKVKQSGAEGAGAKVQFAVPQSKQKTVEIDVREDPEAQFAAAMMPVDDK